MDTKYCKMTNGQSAVNQGFSCYTKSVSLALLREMARNQNHNQLEKSKDGRMADNMLDNGRVITCWVY